MNAVVRWTATAVLLIGGAGLMIEGRGLWDWAAGEASGDELLLVASAAGDMDRAKRAIADGASLEVYSNTGCTPLAFAAGNGDERLVSFLLSHGASVHTPLECGRSALEFATLQGCHAATVRQLLDAGADPDGTNRPIGWNPPLVNAASNGKLDAVRVLLTYGADANPHLRGRCETSPLQAALDTDSADLAALLRRYGAVR